MTDTPSSIPAVGAPAPPLRLTDDAGTIQDISAQRGRWVVLFFYPKDFTAGCTTEVCEFRDLNGEFDAIGATVWSVSILDADSKAKFKAEHGLNFPLLADPDHAVAAAYGVWVEKQNYGKTYMGIARTTFLIDPDGSVARVWTKVKPEGHAATVLEQVRAAASDA
jgi:peroxiredoxin Q/BCP